MIGLKCINIYLLVYFFVLAMILCLGIYKIIDKIIKEKNKFLYKFLDSVVIGFVYGACFIAIIHLSFWIMNFKEQVKWKFLGMKSKQHIMF